MKDKFSDQSIKERILLFLVGCVFVFDLFLPWRIFADTHITFLDVSQGDAIWVRDESGFNGLIDTGDAEHLALVLSALEGVNHLDSVLWTCDREEHGGGLPELLHTLPVGEIVFNGFSSASELMNNVLAAAASETVPLVGVGQDDTLTWGLNILTVLHPEQDYGDAGENSLVVMLSRGDVDVLLMGDAGWDAENSLLASGQSLTAEVIKLGNHGTITSTSTGLLEAVNPEVAIISCGEEPSPVILDRLVDNDITTYRTDLQGNIRIDIGAYGYRVYAEAEPVCQVTIPLVAWADLDAPDVHISSIHVDGEVPQTESDEYCELINYGGPVSLAGWQLNAGQEGQDVIFPEDAILPRYGRCRIYTNEVHENSCAGCTFGSTVPVWRNTHDCGYLYDAEGNLVDSFCY